LGTALIVPKIYRELLLIVVKVPKAIDYLTELFEPIKELLIRDSFFSGNQFTQFLNDFNFVGSFSSTGTNALSQLLSSTPVVIGGAINLLLVPVFTWFLLTYSKQIRVYLKSLIPVDLRAIVKANLQRTNVILWGILKGQLLVASILAVFYMVGFSIIGLQSAIAIGAIAGLCRVVPYLDVIVGALLSFIVIISQSSGLGMMIGVAAVIAIVQAIDGMVITPRIIGDRAGIHPVLVIASVISFGDWFGLLGIVIAVPAVAVVFASLQEAMPYYRNSPFYLGKDSHRSKS
jgi:predicted PurR-regulated permease PerM